ncbi:hypothetical protein pipiens_007344, partial [Culex pipiens pipiens]
APSSCLGFWRRLLVELESPVYLVVSPAIGLVFNVRQLQKRTRWSLERSIRCYAKGHFLKLEFLP